MDRTDQNNNQQQNDTKHDDNQSSVNVSAFKVFESFQKPMATNQAFNQITSDKQSSYPIKYQINASHRSIQGGVGPTGMSSRELLSEPNLYNTTHSPNTLRLEEKEQEYRTILNKAVRALEKTRH